MIWENGWAWVIAAAGLGLIEMLIPGYIFLGTAIAVLFVGIALLAGVSVSLATLLIATAVLSLLCWYILRRTMGVQKGQVRIWDRDINDN